MKTRCWLDILAILMIVGTASTPATADSDVKNISVVIVIREQPPVPLDSTSPDAVPAFQIKPDQLDFVEADGVPPIHRYTRLLEP